MAARRDDGGDGLRRLRRALCVDFEAVRATDGSLIPVEIGIAMPGGIPNSRMIRPDPSWPASASDPSWRGGVTYEMAKSEGIDAPLLASWASRALHGRVLLSDACHVDQPLLDRLMACVGLTAPRLEPFFTVMDALREEDEALDSRIVNAWIVEIDEKRGEPHRAGEDARVRAELLRRVLEHMTLLPATA